MTLRTCVIRTTTVAMNCGGLYVLSLLYFGTAALQCYSCHGSFESECAQEVASSAMVHNCSRSEYILKGKLHYKPFNENFFQDSNRFEDGQDETTCVYVKIKAYGQYSDTVHRGCNRHKDYCERIAKSIREVVECHTCNFDLC